MNMKLDTPAKCVRIIERKELKERVFKALEKSGDPSNMRLTLEDALDNILECRIDKRSMPTNPNGEWCVLTLMGMHVYTWHNKELLEAVTKCFDKQDIVTKDWLKKNNLHNEFIIELDDNDKRIYATN